MATFAIMSGAAGYDGAREQMRPLTDRTLQMREASYDVLLEWMANSTVARSNSNASERSRMEDPTAWLEVETETKSQNGSSSPPGWWEPSTPGQPAQSGCPAVPDQDALCYRSRPGTDRLAVVVCDGAGRAAEGRIGAPAAAAAVLESCSELTGSPNQDRPNLLRCTVTTVRQTVIQIAATSGISLREYVATLTALIQANGRAASAQVGDGAGVVGAVAGWMLTSEPQRGEHANETWFITQEDAIYRRCVSAEIIGVQRVMVGSEDMVGAEGMMGLTLKQPGNVRYAPYFDGALSGLESNHSSPGKNVRADAETAARQPGATTHRRRRHHVPSNSFAHSDGDRRPTTKRPFPSRKGG